MKEQEILSNYLPERAVERVYKWILEHRIHFIISKSRRSKLGDYRPPTGNSHHRISVNHDLNKYAFLITFVHELAHLRVFEKYKTAVLPHGKEWKQEYRSLMSGLLQDGLFPPELKKALIRSVRNTKASSTSDITLSRILKTFDAPSDKIHLEDLEKGTCFTAASGLKFRKGEKRRTRFKCLNLQNNRLYIFHPLTPVQPIVEKQ